MKLVGLYYYNYFGSTYSICYTNIYNKVYSNVVLTTCSDKNITVSNFNPSNAYWGYIQNANNLVPVVPVKYSDFHLLMGFSGLLFGAFIFFFLAKLLTDLKG